MAKKFPDEVKLKALGLIKAGRDLKELVNELDVHYPKLLQWRSELNKKVETCTLTSIVDVDQVIVHEVAERVKNDLIELDPTQAKVIKGEIADVVSGIDGYQLLSVKLQTVALTLANKIDEASEDECFNTPAGIESLVSSLSRLQEAFFNKNGTNINILNAPSGSASKSKFQALKKA